MAVMSSVAHWGQEAAMAVQGQHRADTKKGELYRDDPHRQAGGRSDQPHRHSR